MNFLKKEILNKIDDNHYTVNFSDDFKILIKEAKHLEKMGYKIPKTIINISLQEREYYQYDDKLNLMLEDYNNTVNSLNDIDRTLLFD
jgi:dynein heavy chain